MGDGATTPRVKICGLCRREDAEAAAGLGADYLGMILSPGFGRSVDVARGRELVTGLGPVPVAVVVDETPDEAARLAAAVGAGVIQLHGDEDPQALEALASLGDWALWKAVRAASEEEVAGAVSRYGGLVQGLLVEGFAPGVVGGGGMSLAPDMMRLRTLVPAPLTLVLAGGLGPDNVAAAVARHGPDVVDVSSGVERERGRKDPDLLRRFIQGVRGETPDPAQETMDRGDPS